MLEAVEADWLAQIAAVTISNTKTGEKLKEIWSLPKLKAERQAWQHLLRKNAEFACGILSRVES